MQIQFKLEPEDVVTAFVHVDKRKPRKSKFVQTIIVLALGLTLLLVWTNADSERNPQHQIDLRSFCENVLLMGAMIAFVLVVFHRIDRPKNRRAVAHALSKLDPAVVYGTREITLTPEGIRQKSDREEVTFYWKHVSEIEALDNQLFIYTSKTSFVLIPRRAFSDETKFMVFVETARRLFQQSQNRPDDQIIAKS